VVWVKLVWQLVFVNARNEMQLALARAPESS
jgi:hypothetical protein